MAKAGFHHRVLGAICLAAFVWGAAPTAHARGPVLEKATARQCGLDKKDLPDRLRLHRIQSEELGKRFCVLVYLPEGALEPGQMAHLLVMLHGLGAGPDQWIEQAGLHRVLDNMMKHGILPATITVMPGGGNGYWTDWTDGKHPYGRMVMREMIPAVARAYPISPEATESAIAGISMGGFGALSLGLRHPDRFGTLIGMSATDLDMATDEQPKRKTYRRIFGSPPDKAAVHAVNPLQLVQRGAGDGQRVLLVHGTDEPDKFREGTIRLGRVLEQKGVPVEVRKVDGGKHSFDSTWNAVTLRWWLTLLGKGWAE